MPKTRIPSYRLHKASGQAVVVLDGHSAYLGKYGTAESKEKYERSIREWLENTRRHSAPAGHQMTLPAATALTIPALILAYWRHVESYYVKDGKPTSEQDTIRQALRFVRRLYGSTRALDFGPLALKAVRQAMIEHPISRKVKVRDPLTGRVEKDPTTGEERTEARVLRHGLARTYINDQMARIKRMFAWAVEEELLPASVHQALLRVKGLRKGKTTAREKPRVKPVRLEHIEAVLPLVSPIVRAMIEVQLLSSCRPQDVVQMRRETSIVAGKSGSIDRGGTRPSTMKMTWTAGVWSSWGRVLNPFSHLSWWPTQPVTCSALGAAKSSARKNVATGGEPNCGRPTSDTRSGSGKHDRGRSCATATTLPRIEGPSHAPA